MKGLKRYVICMEVKDGNEYIKTFESQNGDFVKFSDVIKINDEIKRVRRDYFLLNMKYMIAGKVNVERLCWVSWTACILVNLFEFYMIHGMR